MPVWLHRTDKGRLGVPCCFWGGSTRLGKVPLQQGRQDGLTLGIRLTGDQCGVEMEFGREAHRGLGTRCISGNIGTTSARLGKVLLQQGGEDGLALCIRLTGDQCGAEMELEGAHGGAALLIPSAVLG
ncbi:hypothetical protein D3C78_1537770 [compost metagenome]